MCETGPAVPWQRIQNLLVTPLFPEKKKAATVNQANSEVLTTLVKNWLYGPAEVRRVDGTPLTGAELETVKAQIRLQLGRHWLGVFLLPSAMTFPPAFFKGFKKDWNRNRSSTSALPSPSITSCAVPGGRTLTKNCSRKRLAVNVEGLT